MERPEFFIELDRAMGVVIVEAPPKPAKRRTDAGRTFTGSPVPGVIKRSQPANQSAAGRNLAFSVISGVLAVCAGLYTVSSSYFKVRDENAQVKEVVARVIGEQQALVEGLNRMNEAAKRSVENLNNQVNMPRKKEAASMAEPKTSIYRIDYSERGMERSVEIAARGESWAVKEFKERFPARVILRAKVVK